LQGECRLKTGDHRFFSPAKPEAGLKAESYPGDALRPVTGGKFGKVAAAIETRTARLRLGAILPLAGFHRDLTTGQSYTSSSFFFGYFLAFSDIDARFGRLPPGIAARRNRGTTRRNFTGQ
jgi:hypothetical protein